MDTIDEQDPLICLLFVPAGYSHFSPQREALTLSSLAQDAQQGAEAGGLGEGKPGAVEAAAGLQPAPAAGPPGPVGLQGSGVSCAS